MATNNLKSPFILDRKNKPREIFSLTDVKTSEPVTVGVVEYPAGTSLDTLLASADTRPYKVYSALLTQTGTAAPVATVLENNLGATIVWTRDAGGEYAATASSAVFTENKTALLVGNGNATWDVLSTFCANWQTTTLIQYTSIGASTMGEDSIYVNTLVEIRVYL